MSKKSDLVFDNVDDFLIRNPHFAITKPVPNTAAIRAVLRGGGTLEGVKLVEAASAPANPTQDTPLTTEPIQTSDGKPVAFMESAKKKLAANA